MLFHRSLEALLLMFLRSRLGCYVGLSRFASLLAAEFAHSISRSFARHSWQIG
jgi:hypothetical protein